MIKAIENTGVRITHARCLCAWKPEWDNLPEEEKAQLKARQGVAYELQEDCLVLNPDTGEMIPADGTTIGEIVMRGNIVMKGYLKARNKKSLQRWLVLDWDIAVMHEDGYIEIKDRAKISSYLAEKISSIEIEKVLFDHPSIVAVAVVAQPDEMG